MFYYFKKLPGQIEAMEEKNGLISYLKREMKELLRKTLEMISCDRCDNVVPAVLYYISQHFICWDFVGMTIQDPKFVGMDPNSLRPKPRPSTPRDFFDMIQFQYQNEIVWIIF